MTTRRQVTAALLGAVGFFLGVQLGALALVEPFKTAGYQAVANPQDPTNSLLYFGVLLVATAGMLLLFRFGRTVFLRAFLLASSGFIAAYVFSVLLPSEPSIGGVGVSVGTVLGAGLVILGLFAYPEWWVIDASGLIMGMGAAALFGISFGILPAILLLVALAVYDAISVYGTEHMLSLASGVMELRVPVLVIIPTTLEYSFIDMAEEMAAEVTAGKSDSAADAGAAASAPDGDGGANDDADPSAAEPSADDDPFERDAFFIGLGDAVIPTILVASAATFATGAGAFGIGFPALGAMAGTILGLLVLLRMVLKGRPHAGLPLLNGGAILGYLLGAVAAGIPLASAVGLSPYL